MPNQLPISLSLFLSFERERERERVGGNELPTSTTDTNTYVSKDITKNEV